MTGNDDFDFVTKITTEAVETAESFIFKTISPFCSRVVLHEISKAELTEALQKQQARPRIDDGMTDRCPSCMVILPTRYFGARSRIITKTTGEKYVDIGGYTYRANYCPECGQKIDYDKRGKKG